MLKNNVLNHKVALAALLGRELKGRVPGQMMSLKISGSHSHNLDLPESDVDFLGVYAAPTKAIVGMTPPTETVVGDKPDFTIHEVGKFARLLLKGNPTVVETLFSDRMIAQDRTFWPELVEHRREFLSQRSLKQYLGYCQGQLQRLIKGNRLHSKGGEYNTKWAYHMVRLAQDGLSIVNGQDPRVWRHPGPDRELLMSIRRGEFTQKRVEDIVVDLVKQIDDKKPWNLPEEGPDMFLNDWLLCVREALWQQSIPLTLTTSPLQ